MWKSPRIIMRFAISVGHGFAKNLREYPVTLAMSVFLNLLIEESYLFFCGLGLELLESHAPHDLPKILYES